MNGGARGFRGGRRGALSFFENVRTEARKRRELEKDRASFFKLDERKEPRRARGDAGRAGRAQQAAGVAQGGGLGGTRGHPALAPQGRFLGESADVRWAARGEEGSRGRGKRRPLGYWRRRRRRGASARTRARLTPPRHATLPHLGAMLRRRARRGERGGEVWEAQATKVGLGLFVSLRRRACTRLCLCSSKAPSVRR